MDREQLRRRGDNAATSRASVTRLIEGAASGDKRAAEALLPLVYDELRALAQRRMRQECSAGEPDHTLQATALVHEAFMRLVGGSNGGADALAWDSRWHFFAAAAEAMRRILVEAARRRRRLKRGGGVRRVDLSSAGMSASVAVDDPPDELLELDAALDKLGAAHPQKAELVKLRYFAGLTIEQAAKALGVSVPTANRHWAFARAWLFHHISTSVTQSG
jgi:RNA polymerase sigma factor (TIGR02999 family)